MQHATTNTAQAVGSVYQGTAAVGGGGGSGRSVQRRNGGRHESRHFISAEASTLEARMGRAMHMMIAARMYHAKGL